MNRGQTDRQTQRDIERQRQRQRADIVCVYSQIVLLSDTEDDAQLCQSLGKRGLQSGWFTQFATDIHEPLPCAGMCLPSCLLPYSTVYFTYILTIKDPHVFYGFERIFTER